MSLSAVITGSGFGFDCRSLIPAEAIIQHPKQTVPIDEANAQSPMRTVPSKETIVAESKVDRSHR